MKNPLEPIRVQSLKSACLQRLEALILSGEWKIGQRLPAERDLAARLSVSRPVLHEAMVDLAAKGLVTIEPRRGIFINDYRTRGSMAVLSSLLAFSGGNLDPAFTHSLIEFRRTMEVDSAGLAARQRNPAHLAELQDRIQQERSASSSEIQLLVELDFSIHLLLAIASGNLIYPLVINSFKSVYIHLTGLFFTRYAGTTVVEEVFQFHERILANLMDQDETAARETMTAMLAHGERYLKGV